MFTFQRGTRCSRLFGFPRRISPYPALSFAIRPPPRQGYGGLASTDVTLQGLIDSVRAEEEKSIVSAGMIYNPGEVTPMCFPSPVALPRLGCQREQRVPAPFSKQLEIDQNMQPDGHSHPRDHDFCFSFRVPHNSQLMKELENVQHGALVKQPDVSHAHSAVTTVVALVFIRSSVL